MWSRIKKEWQSRHPFVEYVGVFLIVVLMYWPVQQSQTFLDPDSFYHVKMALLIMRLGIVHGFPWLPYTTLAHAYADQHLLYHLLLIPFISLYGPFVGAKASTAIFAALALAAFYAALKAYRVRLPIVFTLMLATSTAFMFRVNLTKTSALSIATLMLGLVLIKKKKPIALFALSWAYVYLYAGWPLMGVVVVAFLIGRALTDRMFEKHPLHSWADVWFWRRLFSRRPAALRDFFRAEEGRNFFAVSAGLVSGLVLNPYFPVNLRFYWEQIVQIAVLNYHDKISVGVEWYPYPMPDFYYENAAIFMAFAAGMVLMIMLIFWDDAVKKSVRRLTCDEVSPMIASFFLAILFFILALRSRRNVEYFAPFAMFAAALLFTAVSDRVDWSALCARVRGLLPKKAATAVRLDVVLTAYVAILLVFFGARNYLGVRDTYQGGIAWTKFSKTGAWLAAHVPPGSIITHSDWDEFPPLFFWDDTDRYLCGLDPRFFYRQDPKRYWFWVDVSTGKLTGDVTAQVRKVLGSAVFVVARDHVDMQIMLERDPHAVRVYQDEDAIVYETR
jgi:hypothetical protein